MLLWDMNGALAAQSSVDLGNGAEGHGVEVRDTDAVMALAQDCAARHGRLDVLVASAGIAGANGKVVDCPVDEWQRIIDINLNGMFHTCHAVLPQMVAQGYGRAVLIASVAGKVGNPNAGPIPPPRPGSWR